MRIDVVITFYRKYAQWQLVAYGLGTNSAHIKRVIVVNDEPWADKPSLPDFKVSYLDHEHDGFGAARCFNQGAAAVDTEYFLHIDADMLLEPGSIAKNLDYAEPTMLIGGLIHDTAYDPATIDPSNPPKLREDWRLAKPAEQWAKVRNGHLLVHKPTHDVIGGHDEGYIGYGLIDYDYGARWMLGGGEFELGDGAAYHIGGIDRPEDKVWKQVSNASIERLNNVLERYHTAGLR